MIRFCLPFSFFTLSLVEGFLCLFFPLAASAIPAFPGAQGWGANSRGGRSGAVINNRSYNSRVIHVTNLASSGAGSLAAALAAGGPRYVVFDVSGTINMSQSNMTMSGFVTVAGQTSPGGIVIVNGGIIARPTSATNAFLPNWQANQDITIRHLRGRSTVYAGGNDNIRLQYSHDAIVDHCSFNNCCDEIADLIYTYNMTFSWCTMSESNIQCGGETNYHGFQGGNAVQLSLVNNFFSHHSCRVPQLDNCYSISCPPQTGAFEVVNNVLYNCANSQTFGYNNSAPINLVGNYMKSGPNHTYSSSNPTAWSATGSTNAYLAGNYTPGAPGAQQSSFLSGGSRSSSLIQPTNFSNQTDGQTAWQEVTARVGAFPRDSTDRRLIRESQVGTGGWRVLTSQELNSQTFTVRDPLTLPQWTRPADTDNDGIPDAWEAAHGLNPSDSGDFRTLMNGGYEAIEVYINELSDTLVQTGRWPATWVEKNPAPARLTRLIHAFPNPLTAEARIHFSIPRDQTVEVSIYTAGGKRVKTLYSGLQSAGDHSLIWDGRRSGGGFAPAGTYFIRIQSKEQEAVKKIVLIR